MGYIIRMPRLGMSMQSGTILDWHADPGDSVEEGELLAEVESEKTVAEVTAKEAGVLRRRFVEEGESVAPNEPVGIVAAADEDVEHLLEDAPDQAAAGGASGGPDASGPPDAGADRISPRARRKAEELGVDPAEVDGTGPDGAVVAEDIVAAAETRAEESAASTSGPGESASAPSTATPDSVRATPRAKVRARELDVELQGISGTGPRGAVTAADVETATDAGAGPAAEPETRSAADQRPAATVTSERRLDGMRRTIADRLSRSSRDAPHVTVHRDVPAGELLEARAVADEYLDPEVNTTDLLLLAVSATLADHPAFNATFEDGVHRQYREQNLGVAVDVDDGLLTPVVRNVESRSLDELAAERGRLVDAVLAGDYTLDDVQGGTFTVSNLGPFGVDSFTPIIDPPQVAILGVDRITREPVPDDDGGVGFERRIGVDLSFDHRVVDGADAARFLDTFAEHVRSPWSFVLDRT